MGAIAYIVERAAGLDIKRFTADHIEADATLVRAALACIAAYTPERYKLDSSFLASLKRQSEADTLLTSKQLAGACNTMLLVHKNAQPKPQQEQKTQPAAGLAPKKGYVVVKEHYRPAKKRQGRVYWVGTKAS